MSRLALPPARALVTEQMEALWRDRPFPEKIQEVLAIHPSAILRRPPTADSASDTSMEAVKAEPEFGFLEKRRGLRFFRNWQMCHDELRVMLLLQTSLPSHLGPPLVMRMRCVTDSSNPELPADLERPCDEVQFSLLYLPGYDLHDLFHQGDEQSPCFVDFVRRAGRRLLEILQGFAALSVTHRDIKIENVVVRSFQEPESLVVIDYDTAVIDGSRPLAEECDTNIGSPGMLAPEIAQGRCGSTSASCDIFSFGCLLFTLFDPGWRTPLELPDDDDGDYERMAHLAAQPVPWDIFTGDAAPAAMLLKARNPGLTQGAFERSPAKRNPFYKGRRSGVVDKYAPDLAALITECMHHDPAKRPTAELLLTNPWFDLQRDRDADRRSRNDIIRWYTGLEKCVLDPIVAN